MRPLSLHFPPPRHPQQQRSVISVHVAYISSIESDSHQLLPLPRHFYAYRRAISLINLSLYLFLIFTILKMACNYSSNDYMYGLCESRRQHSDPEWILLFLLHFYALRFAMIKRSSSNNNSHYFPSSSGAESLQRNILRQVCVGGLKNCFERMVVYLEQLIFWGPNIPQIRVRQIILT